MKNSKKNELWCCVDSSLWDSASTCTRYGADSSHLYIIFMISYKEGEKSTDVNVGVLSAASALSECLVVVSRGGN